MCDSRREIISAPGFYERGLEFVADSNAIK